MSSVDLSVLTFALSSWLDGSAQLRRSLIFLPLGIGGHREQGVPPASPRRAQSTGIGSGRANGGPSRGHLADWCAWWLQKPDRDLDETEKSLMGMFDVSSAIILLRFLGTSPVLPFILNPLTVVLPLPRNLRVNTVRWLRVVLTSFALSCLHEGQRASVSAICTYLKKRRLHQQRRDLQNIVISGDERKLRDSHSHTLTTSHDDDDDDEFSNEDDECLICAAGSSDQSMSDSISSLTSSSSNYGQLEAFCVNAPQKHLMHRKCFLDWKEAYKEQRAHQPQPVVTLLCEDQSLPVPGSTLWMRARAILAAAGLVRVEDIHSLPPRPDMWMPSLRPDENQDGESVLTLLNVERRDRRHSHVYSRPRGGTVSSPASLACLNPASTSASSSDTRTTPAEPKPNAVLATLVTKWPPCPGCRSAVKMNFLYAPTPATPVPSPSDTSARARYTKLAKSIWKVWQTAWHELVTGRTILMKTMTQLMFAMFILSMMRYRKKKGMRGTLIARLT